MTFNNTRKREGSILFYQKNLTVSFLVTILMGVNYAYSADVFQLSEKDKMELPALLEKANSKAYALKKYADKEVIKILRAEGSIPKAIFSFGVIGNTYEINDPNITAWGSAMLHSYFTSNPVSIEDLKDQIYNVSVSVPRTRQEHSYRVDMTATLKEDKYIEMGADFGGKRLLALKGTKINPFNHIAFPYTLWFLEEGDDEYLSKAMESQLSMIVITNGNMDRISKKHPGIHMSKGTHDLLYRMSIRSVPARAKKCNDAPLLCVDLLRVLN